jgi:hypothetical protein
MNKINGVSFSCSFVLVRGCFFFVFFLVFVVKPARKINFIAKPRRDVLNFVCQLFCKRSAENVQPNLQNPSFESKKKVSSATVLCSTKSNPRKTS